MLVLKWIGIYLAFQAISAFAWWFIWQVIKATGRVFAGHPQRPPFK